MDDTEEVKERNPPANSNKYFDPIDQDSILCMKCSKRFMNFEDIWYPQQCVHPICKIDLKNLIFQ